MSMPRPRHYGTVYANQDVEFEVNNAIGTLLTIVVHDVPDATARKALVSNSRRFDAVLSRLAPDRRGWQHGVILRRIAAGRDDGD